MISCVLSTCAAFDGSVAARGTNIMFVDGRIFLDSGRVPGRWSGDRSSRGEREVLV